jgi:hypothetical protein
MPAADCGVLIGCEHCHEEHKDYPVGKLRKDLGNP